MKAKVWLIGWLLLTLLGLGVSGYLVYKVDPFFHYHEPDVTKYYYHINNQRSQNDGIIKHFTYDAMITGTSLTENFKTSEMDEIFNCKSIKVPFNGCSYYEVNYNIEKALLANPDLNTIVRSLDMHFFYQRADEMRTDLGKYPEYLYDDNVFNDVEYLLNRDIVFARTYQMIADAWVGYEPGITSFDEYSNWQNEHTYGINTVCPGGLVVNDVSQDSHLTEEEKITIKENIDKNVTALADEYPEVDFYYFYPINSAVWWCELYNQGTLIKQLETERFITELILPHENIHLFSFNNVTEITTDINHYQDPMHYAEWINTLMLQWMHDDKYRLTRENLEEYSRTEYDFYTNFDYNSLNGQEDYEDDYEAARLLGL